MIRNRRRKIDSTSHPSLFFSKDIAQKNLLDQLKNYLRSHYLSFIGAIRRLSCEPLQSLATSFVVAIALSLPSTLYVAVMNLEKLGSGAETTTSITVFLEITASQLEMEKLQKNLLLDPHIASVEYISSQQGLDEFRMESGFGDILQMLDENPLPAVLLIQPEEIVKHNSDVIEKLSSKLKKEALISDIQVDIKWLQRLQAILAVGERLTFVLGAVLAFGVFLIIGNTVRLALESRSHEVIVVKLVGGTNSYIRRPFLYTGFWYGVMGGALAWALVAASLYWMSIPVTRLAELYQSSFQLKGLGFFGLTAMVTIGAGLGLMGAWLAVTRQLVAIEPE